MVVQTSRQRHARMHLVRDSSAVCYLSADGDDSTRCYRTQPLTMLIARASRHR